MADDRDDSTRAETTLNARLECIRVRFAIKLADNIQRTETTISRMSGNGSDAVDAVSAAYRWLHDVCGIAPTLGFEATGRSARSCAAILVEPFRAQRELSADELSRLMERVQSLKRQVRTETQSTGRNGSWS